MEIQRDAALGRLLVALLSERRRGLDEVVAIAVAARLGGLMRDALERQERSGALGAEARTALQRAARQEAADDALVEREVGEVLALLAPFRPVPLKGRALALAVWPRPAWRPPGDLNLLLEPGAVSEAAALLARHRYRRAPTEAMGPLRPADTGIELLPPAGRRLAIDLHARLFRSVGHRLDTARVLARARPGTLAGQPVRLLDAADNLLFVFVHAAKHGVRQLKWLLDLYAVALGTDAATWSLAVRRARATRTTRPLWAAARLIADLDGTGPLLEVALARLRPPSPWPQLLGALISRPLAAAGRIPDRVERYALELALEPSIASRLRMGAGLLARLVHAGDGRAA